MKVYVASSWRNKQQPEVVNAIRAAGIDVYDFRHPKPGNDGFSWSAIDPDWQSWTPEQLIKGLENPVAQEGFHLDFDAMCECDACVLVLPSGRSAHLEAGWFAGQGKTVHVLLADGEPELMYLLTTRLHTSIKSVIRGLKLDRELSIDVLHSAAAWFEDIGQKKWKLAELAAELRRMASSREW